MTSTAVQLFLLHFSIPISEHQEKWLGILSLFSRLIDQETSQPLLWVRRLIRIESLLNWGNFFLEPLCVLDCPLLLRFGMTGQDLKAIPHFVAFGSSACNFWSSSVASLLHHQWQYFPRRLRQLLTKSVFPFLRWRLYLRARFQVCRYWYRRSSCPNQAQGRHHTMAG